MCRYKNKTHMYLIMQCEPHGLDADAEKKIVTVFFCVIDFNNFNSVWGGEELRRKVRYKY